MSGDIIILIVYNSFSFYFIFYSEWNDRYRTLAGDRITLIIVRDVKALTVSRSVSIFNFEND